MNILGPFLKHQENDPKCQKVYFFFIKLKDNDQIVGKMEKKLDIRLFVKLTENESN